MKKIDQILVSRDLLIRLKNTIKEDEINSENVNDERQSLKILLDGDVISSVLNEINKLLVMKITSRRRTINKYYKDALLNLQNHIDIATNFEELKKVFVVERPKYYRKTIWNETINELINYIKAHENNFKDGKFFCE